MTSLDSLRDANAENSTLGSVLHDNAALHDIAPILVPEDFGGYAQSEAWSAVLDMYAEGKAIDILTLGDELKKRGVFDKLGGDDFLISLIQSTPHHVHATHYAEIVKDKSTRRKVHQAGQEIVSQSIDITTPTAELLETATTKVFAVAVQGTKERAVEVRVVAKDIMPRIQAKLDRGVSIPGLSTGLPALDNRIEGFQNSHMITVAGRPGSGKAQPVSSHVVTPSGFVPIGSVKVGDAVIGKDGCPAIVRGVYPQGKKQVFKCYFSDGSSARCCNEHLWEVWTPGNYPWKSESQVRPLAEIRGLLASSNGKHVVIDNHQPVQFAPKKPLAIHPYVMGFFLSEGEKTIRNNVRFSNPEYELVLKVDSLIPDKVVKRGVGDHCHYLIVSKEKESPFKEALKHYGLFPYEPDKRFIPDDYLFASVEDRMELLRGYFDGGRVSHIGDGLFRVNQSGPIYDQLVFLIRSLGGGFRRLGKSLLVQFPPGVKPFSSSRHEFDFQEPAHAIYRKFVSVEPDSEEECVCIRVDGEYYLTDNFLVTHNTSFVINAVENLARNTDKGILFFSLEMSEPELLDKIVCVRSNVDSKKLKNTKKLTPRDIRRLEFGSKSLEKDRSRIFIIDRPEIGMGEIAAIIRKYASKPENNLGLVVIDYLQLVAVPEKSRDNRATQVGDISRKIKTTARSVNIPIIALSQLNRAVEQREDRRPTMADIRESGNIEQDSDIVLLLYRDDYYDEEEKPGLIELITGKNRHGEQGTDFAVFHRPSGRFLSVGRRSEGLSF